MIIGIGCDIVDHHLTSRLGWENVAKLSRILSVNEIALCAKGNNIKFIAGRFAAKEAILKSMGTGMEDGIALTDIEVLQLDNGKPFIKLNGAVKDLASSLGINIFHVSLSHGESHSIAMVIAEE